jgi:hypothetical protein
LRADRPFGLTIDDMRKKPIKGTSDWKHYDVVVDVPADASAIAYGIRLTGRGRVWIHDLKFEAVGRDVPITATGPAPAYAIGNWLASHSLPGTPRGTAIRVWMLCAGILTLIGWIMAFIRPDRSIPDRLAGTRLMMH